MLSLDDIIFQTRIKLIVHMYLHIATLLLIIVYSQLDFQSNQRLILTLSNSSAYLF